MGEHSDIAQTFNALRDERRALRSTFGIDCPRCGEVRPKATPSLLLPGQRCKVDGYIDPRARLTEDQRRTAVEAAP